MSGPGLGLGVPGEPGSGLTQGWWHNRLILNCTSKPDCLAGHCTHRPAGWVKALSFSGSYESNFEPGTVAPKPSWNAGGVHAPKDGRGKLWIGDDWGHQPAIILGKRYGFFVVDVDDEELYLSESLVAEHCKWEQRISSSRPGHWHVLVWVPPSLRALWPLKEVPGANIKGKGDGFVPVPGCYHYTGTRYEPTGRPALVADADLLLSIINQKITERAALAGYAGGKAEGRQGVLLRELLGWPDPLEYADGKERWEARYAELNETIGTDGTVHDIDPDPASLFERQWAWREAHPDPARSVTWDAAFAPLHSLPSEISDRSDRSDFGNGSSVTAEGRGNGSGGDGSDRSDTGRDDESGKSDYCASPNEPLKVAQEFVAETYPAHPDWDRIVCWRKIFLAWEGHWKEVPADALRSQVYEWLAEKKYLKADTKGEILPVPWNPNQAKVNNVIDALESSYYLSQDIEEDDLLGNGSNGNGSKSSQDQVYQNQQEKSISKKYSKSVCVTCYVTDDLGNGAVKVLDLQTLALTEPTPLWFSQHIIRFRYDPEAACPEWGKFLSGLWPDDPDSVAMLQEWAGYLLSGETIAQKMMAVIGPKRGGKGTIAKILQELVGAQYCTGPTLDVLCEQFGMQPFIGKRLAVIGDARLRARGKDISTAVSRMLVVSGGDTISIERKHLVTWTGVLPTRIMLLSNETPHLADASGALADRFLYLQLTRSWLGAEDLGLIDRLREELPGILNWAIRGYQRLAGNGFVFTTPESASATKEEMESLASPEKSFIEEACNVGPLEWEFASIVFAHWRAWCKDKNIHPGSDHVFSRSLRAALGGQLDTRTGKHPVTGKRARIMQGISISADANISEGASMEFMLQVSH